MLTPGGRNINRLKGVEEVTVVPIREGRYMAGGWPPPPCWNLDSHN